MTLVINLFTVKTLFRKQTLFLYYSQYNENGARRMKSKDFLKLDLSTAHI